jgi:hypothetical protein
MAKAVMSEALQVALLLGAAAPCYSASSSRLLVPSSLQVLHQSVQVDNHRLCPGMPLNPVYDIIYLGDDVLLWSRVAHDRRSTQCLFH